MNISSKCSKLNKKKILGVKKKRFLGKIPKFEEEGIGQSMGKKKKGHKFAKKTDILVIRNGVMALCVEGSRA